MSATMRSSARETITSVQRSASTRASRAKARSAKQTIDVNESDVAHGNSCKLGDGGKSETKSTSKGILEDVENSTRQKSQPPSSKAISASAAATSPSVSSSARVLPLSPSKTATNVRLPLSPIKRPNDNPPAIHSGFSPPKMMKNDGDLGSPRKEFSKQTGVAPPQSPIRVGPPRSPSGKKVNSPSLTPRSLFSARSKSSSSSFSKPLRTSCHPSSPMKSPPAMHLANILKGSSPLKSPGCVKRSNLFADVGSGDRACVSKLPSTPYAASSRSSNVTDAPSNVVPSPKTPRADSVSIESSPSKPTASPAKPLPSKTPPSAPPSSTTPKVVAKTSSPSRSSPPLGSPTSPAESRMARLNLNAAPSPYAAARKAFHTATPSGELKGREAERKEIVDFIEDHVKGAKSGALYVSGAPGTGKTATLNTIINDYKSTCKCLTIYINCMSVRNSSLIYAKILAEGSTSKTAPAPKGGTKGAQKAVEKLVTVKGKPILLFLDEMDQLGDVSNQDVLYTLFEWTFTPGSRLVMVGVANALDLTERILPRLQAKAQRKPRTMNFAPYSQAQLMDILSHRLSTSSSVPSSTDSSPAAPSLVDKSALLFCAKKIAAVSGDARKALDACRYAVEMVEKSSAETTPSATPCSAPLSTPNVGAATPSTVPKKVGITHVMRVLSGVYENAAVATSTAPKALCSDSSSGGGTLTLQQKIIICCLVLIHKTGKNTKVVSVGKLQDVYKKVCQRKGFIPGMSEAGGGDLAEFLSILSNIEASGILTLKKEKVSRDSKVNLLLDEKELEKALQDDRKLLATILQSDII